MPTLRPDAADRQLTEDASPLRDGDRSPRPPLQSEADADELTDASVASLLTGYATRLAELRRRGIVRTANAPAGDYAEWLVARALGGTIASNTSEKSWDVEAPHYGRLQVKCRLVSNPVKSGQLQTSPFRSWEFERAVFVQLSGEDYSVVRATLIPRAAVQAVASRREHVGGWVVQMRPSLLDSPEAKDISELLRRASRE